ncbi:MFS transporter [Methanimicrococcus blatticola]|uniref:MFS transporter n=1 Tax=Methanimicrococcus blatticola TaxID=91560 RepID=UPI001060DA9A|nr:MFS transporter [Methanimicrococcus blatticola]
MENSTIIENQNPFANWKQKTALFFGSQAITLFGSSLVLYAIIWYITLTTGSGVMTTMIIICSFVPQFAISFFSGVWADKYNRKMLIILADGGIALATLALIVYMLAGNDSIPALLFIAAVRSVGAGIQTPAVNAIIPQIVPPEKLIKVNGINGSLQSIVNLATPAVAGAILIAGEIYNIMMIDVVTAAIGIGILLLIPIAKHKRAQENVQTSYFADLKEGFKYSFNHPFFKPLFIVYAFFTILCVPASFLNILMVTQVFGENYLYLTLNEMSFFIGMLIGGLVIGTWGGFKNRVKTILVGLAAFGVLTCGFGLTQTLWVYLILMSLVGLMMPFVNSPTMSLIQEKADSDKQGRVFSVLQMIMTALMPLAMLFFGPLADIIPVQQIVVYCGILIVILAVVVLFNKKFYQQGVFEVKKEAGNSETQL